MKGKDVTHRQSLSRGEEMVELLRYFFLADRSSRYI